MVRPVRSVPQRLRQISQIGTSARPSWGLDSSSECLLVQMLAFSWRFKPQTRTKDQATSVLAGAGSSYFQDTLQTPSVWAAGPFQRTRDQLVRTSSRDQARPHQHPNQQLLSASVSRSDCQPTQCFATSQARTPRQPTTPFPGSMKESVDLCLPRYNSDGTHYRNLRHSNHNDAPQSQPGLYQQDVTPTTNAWAFGLLCTMPPPRKTTATSSRSGFSVKSQKMFQMGVAKGRQSSEITANYARRRRQGCRLKASRERREARE